MSECLLLRWPGWCWPCPEVSAWTQRPKAEIKTNYVELKRKKLIAMIRKFIDTMINGHWLHVQVWNSNIPKPKTWNSNKLNIPFTTEYHLTRTNRWRRLKHFSFFPNDGRIAEHVRVKYKHSFFSRNYGWIDSPWDRDRLERWSRGKRELGNPESELGWLESRRSRTSRTDCWRNRPPLNINNN